MGAGGGSVGGGINLKCNISMISNGLYGDRISNQAHFVN